jgi:hypothetical protein
MSHLTTDPNDPDLTRGVDNSPVDQAKKYLVLSEEERAKGFVRPYRDSYRHVGESPKYPLRDLTDEEMVRYAQWGYAKFEPYPESELPQTGRFWTQAELDRKGCNEVTSMGRALSETYARDPSFYGATYCCFCRMHRRVSEFVWEADGQRVGS